MVPGNSTVLSRSLLNLQHLFLKPSETGKVHIYIYIHVGVGQNWLKPSPIQRGRGGTLLSSCRGGRTCAVQPGPRVSTSGVPPRPGVSPRQLLSGRAWLGRWLPTLLGGVPKRSSWPRRACMGRPRATFSGRHKSFPMQFLAARADWSQAPPGFDHLLEHQLVSAVGHPLASPQGPAANSSSTLAWLASPWCPVW